LFKNNLASAFNEIFTIAQNIHGRLLLESRDNKEVLWKKKTATGSNWWDKLGKPQHGGEMVIHAIGNIIILIPISPRGLRVLRGWMERLNIG